MISNSFRKFCLPFFILLFSLAVFGQETSYDIWKGKMGIVKKAKEEGNLEKAQKELEDALKIAKFAYFTGNKETKRQALNQIKETAIQLIYIYVENKDNNKINVLAKDGMQLTTYLFDNGYYLEAIELGNVAKDMLRIMNNTNGKEYGMLLWSLGDVYSRLGDYETALKLSLVGIDIIKKTLGENHAIYGMQLSSLSNLYKLLGDYEKALPLALESLKFEHSVSLESIVLSDELEGKKHKILSYNLFILSNIYTKLGNHEKALEIHLEGLSICEDSYGTDNEQCRNYSEWLANKYMAIGELEKAKELVQEAINFKRINLGENNREYANSLETLAAIYYNQDELDSSLTLQVEATRIKADVNGKKTMSYATSVHNLAMLHLKLDNVEQAILLQKESVEILKTTLGEKHYDYSRRIHQLGYLYFANNQADEGMPLILAGNNGLINSIYDVFRFRGEKEKKIFLKDISESFDINQSFSALNSSKINDLIAENLNNELLRKNLLLNSSKNITIKLSGLDDSNINKKITYYKLLKKQLSTQYAKPINDRTISIDSLLNKINSQENDLVILYNTHFNDEINFRKDWKASKAKLGNHEIAIEFTNFVLHDKKIKKTDSVMYAAYLYKKDWTEPKFVSLFEERELKKILLDKSPNELYKSDAFYDLIWSPLEEEIEGNKTVYYSPSGLLNQIQFAAISKNDKVISNDLNLIQLSSTAGVADTISQPEATSALFIGGINYEYSVSSDDEEMIVYNDAYNYLESSSFSNSRGNKSRGESWTYLPGTEKEIKGLQSIFRSNGKSFNTLKGSNATEANFKKLSGNSPNILHIATHGFFYEDLNIKPQRNINLSTEDQYRLAEDPLLRSGLILAGANYAWENGSNPYEQEDGILTAMEISNMDLSNTDIVVLSACETGLGDIDGSEGVYGLQRAFKMAGVNIIIMSLWQVPDEETAEFMNLFYSNWINNNSVKEAFNNAQRVMQKKYKEEPLKWAAFVLFE